MFFHFLKWLAVINDPVKSDHPDMPCLDACSPVLWSMKMVIIILALLLLWNPVAAGLPFLRCNGKEILTFSWGNDFLQYYELVKFFLPCISLLHQSAKKWQATEILNFFIMLLRNPQYAALGAIRAAGFAAGGNNPVLSMRLVQWPEIHWIWPCFQRKRESWIPTMVLR